MKRILIAAAVATVCFVAGVWCGILEAYDVFKHALLTGIQDGGANK